jgi:AcrR family transcriptional regulator
VPGTTESLANRLVGAAVDLVESEGLPPLSFRRVAQVVGVSYGAPIARFGDGRGLLAAVAEHGFLLLDEELAASPTDSGPQRPSAPSAVNALGLRYVEFALRHRNLHRAMHHPDLWMHTPERQLPSPSIARRLARSAEWRARAEAARNKCFKRFVHAVIKGQVAGTVRAGPEGELARVVTALADGFLLQTADGEAERRRDGVEKQLAAAARLFAHAEAGIGRKPAPA